MACRFPTRIVGSQGAQHRELLSYMLFDPRFAARAIEFGRRHACEELGALAAMDEWWRTGLHRSRGCWTADREERR
jgi:hypothetical protein